MIIFNVCIYDDELNILNDIKSILIILDPKFITKAFDKNQELQKTLNEEKIKKAYRNSKSNKSREYIYYN